MNRKQNIDGRQHVQLHPLKTWISWWSRRSDFKCWVSQVSLTLRFDTRIKMSMIFYKNDRVLSPVRFPSEVKPHCRTHCLSTVHFQGRHVGRFSSYFHRGELIKISVLVTISTVANSRVRTARSCSARFSNFSKDPPRSRFRLLIVCSAYVSCWL
jgi:hypothetical protein